MRQFLLDNTYDYELIEYDDRYVLNVLVPGFEKDELEVFVDNEDIVIKGKRKDSADTGEIVSGGFDKTFEKRIFNSNFGEIVEATLKNGILSLMIDKERKKKVVEIS